MELLPKVPDWKVKKVGIMGYATREPTFLFYRDSLDCVEYLLGNPLFADSMDFCPVRLYQDAEQTVRVYTEWLTGNAAWEMQVCYFHTSSSLPILIQPTGNASRWCDPAWGHSVIGQDEHLSDDRR
jgi:hypothetical protein